MELPSPEQLRQLNSELERRVNERTIELEAANRRLRESEARLQAILDCSPLLVYIKDREFRFLFGNRRFEQIVGMRRPEFLGKTDFDLFPADQAQAFRDMDREVFAKQGLVKAEELAFHNDAMHTYVSMKFPLSNEDGTTYALCGVSTDITDRKEVELSLRRYNSALEEFAYVAAHDLQEPLRTVKSYTQLLAKRYRGKLDTDADEFIDYVTSGVDRMSLLIQSLQSFTALGGSRDQQVPEVSLTEVVGNALRNLEAAIRESEAEVIAGELPRVHANPGQMLQLFQNLVSNAIKYRGPERPKIEIFAINLPREWEIVVRDNGIGIDMQYADRIFGVFRRLHGFEYPGSGIGLAIAKKVVESHQGRIWIVSEPGKGSEFHFTLPS